MGLTDKRSHQLARSEREREKRVVVACMHHAWRESRLVFISLRDGLSLAEKTHPDVVNAISGREKER